MQNYTRTIKNVEKMKSEDIVKEVSKLSLDNKVGEKQKILLTINFIYDPKGYTPNTFILTKIITNYLPREIQSHIRNLTSVNLMPVEFSRTNNIELIFKVI